jgi:hypothetical protein
MTRKFCAIISLLGLFVSVPALAASIDPNDPTAVLESKGLSRQDKRFIIAPLFDFSPFSANQQQIVPGFADPLGTGVDPGLRIFSGKVHFMDLLGNFKVAKTGADTEVELPADTLQGINILDNSLALYLSYNGRAYDKSILNLRAAEVVERNGLLVTSETSPLSLAGFGQVSENLFNPLTLHWTRCPAREKREHNMKEALKRRQWPCSVPAVCQCYVI